MNLGFTDRMFRMLAGVGFVVFDYLASSTWEIVLLGLGLWTVTTSFFGWCPFYKLMGFNTCPTNFQNPVTE